MAVPRAKVKPFAVFGILVKVLAKKTEFEGSDGLNHPQEDLSKRLSDTELGVYRQGF